MASLGAINCDLLLGDPSFGKQRLRTWHREGIDHAAAQQMGLGDNELHLVCIEFNTRANVEIWVQLISSQQGSVVSVTNSAGTVYSDCLILKVGEPKLIPYMDSATATVKCRGEIEVVGTRRV